MKRRQRGKRLNLLNEKENHTVQFFFFITNSGCQDLLNRKKSHKKEETVLKDTKEERNELKTLIKEN